MPSGDAHSSEYTSACDERRAWLTGFLGSAGTALVTRKGAYLWTDGRYFQQAARELEGTEFLLMRQSEVPEPWEFCKQNDIEKVGVDYATCSDNFAEDFKGLIATEGNLVDLVWGKSRPKRPLNPVVSLDNTGKLLHILQKMTLLCRRDV